VAGVRAAEALAVSVAALHAIDPSTYVPHELHRGERPWAESNCYIDVWIEVLHAMKLEPLASLSFCLAVDWEGDQWTFFKPPHEDLAELYGLETHELTVWRPLIHNAQEALKAGKIVLTEADAFFLPDTAGTDYRRQHTKTTIGIQELDVEGRVLGYFHNSSYHALRDADFAGLFRLDAAPDPTFLPHFAEFVRTARLVRRTPDALAKTSVSLLRKHLARRPADNPLSRFRERFATDIEWLKSQGLEMYHAYAFATVRQLGAAFDFGARYLRWLERQGEGELEPIAADLDAISNTAKALILKMARAVNGKKAVDFSEMMATMESRWASAMSALMARFGT
jgi:hypothetical protein